MPGGMRALQKNRRPMGWDAREPETQPRLRLCGRFDGEDADEAAHAAFVFEVDDAGDESEESVIFAAADVEAGLVTGAALADENRAGVDELAAEALDAEPLSL